MHAISSDNDNQGNNYTKSSSSITATYHLNNQRDGEVERKGRIRESLFHMPLKANPVWLPLRIPCAVTRYCLLLKVKYIEIMSNIAASTLDYLLLCSSEKFVIPMFFTVFELISCDFSCNLLFMCVCSELSVSHYALVCMLTTSS